MVLLIALPVFAAVALVHRYLQRYAPSNLLVQRVRTSAPRFRTVMTLLLLAATLLVAMHLLAVIVASGAPGCLNLVVLLLAWDAIKIGWLAIAVLLRWFGAAARRSVGHRSSRVNVAPYS